MRIIFWIAFRNLFSRRFRAKHSAIGWIALLGLLLAVAIQTVSLSILGGFEEAFTRSILGFNAHLVLMREGEITHLSEVENKLNAWKSPQGIIAETPFLYREGILTHQSQVRGVVIKGIDPFTFQNVYDVHFQYFPEEKTKVPTLLLGKDLADSLGVNEKNREVSLLSPVGSLKKINFKKFEVAGIFTTGLYEYDSQFSFMNLKAAQTFFKAENTITGIEMKLGDWERAPRLAEKIENELGLPFQVIAWQELNQDIFQALKLEKKNFFLIMGLIILVASGNLMGLMVIFMIHQSREVATLRALGLSLSALRKIFILQGITVAFLGSVAGLTVGGFVSYGLSHFYFVPLAKEIYLVSSLPISLRFGYLMMTFLFSMGVSWLAIQFAARRLTALKLVFS